MFASPIQMGRLPWSCTGIQEELQRERMPPAWDLFAVTRFGIPTELDSILRERATKAYAARGHQNYDEYLGRRDDRGDGIGVQRGR